MSRTAIITGAGSGIGRLTAETLSAAGWRVALVGRRPAPLEEAAQGMAGETLVLPFDVSDAGAVESGFGRMIGAWGRVDMLFNNAGIFSPQATLDELPVAEWQRALDINLTGAVLCARAAFAQMRAQAPQGGRIINNGSISAHAPRPGSVPYTVTKHAMTGLTKCLSLDGRPFGIACGQIDIGNAATEMTAGIARGAAQADGTIKAEPVMDAQHVADAVLHMAELPLSANVQFMTIQATNMPWMARG
ncbi:NAD(P)-dependent dehydrogenase (short-subunit alcohol dehydrogenase family) [Rubricella aquisinus]|uniref:NAD(P)-dependent dehydrogenase (Short-subunit alcohol dehydrogenase family) n=1 Tax=Rubricella aquisinus TaxID=2028108 RepID=A0A840X573_9RHOB|nr:SDR family oxidoreductase [Rubricella aquisinus]MBB5516985.1 NAD(P)-dependent dehydrogenase (short-subunit alcohol dehydrogenase family) [Rubricella aquisinus]